MDFPLLVAVKTKNTTRREETPPIVVQNGKKGDEGGNPSYCSQNERKGDDWGHPPVAVQTERNARGVSPSLSQSKEKAMRRGKPFPSWSKMEGKATRRKGTPITVQNRKKHNEGENPFHHSPKWKEMQQGVSPSLSLSKQKQRQ